MIEETIKMILSLALILILIVYVIKYGLARLHSNNYGKERLLRVIEHIALSSKNSLYLIQSGDRYYLLGVSPEAVNLVQEIDPKEIAAGITCQGAQRPGCFKDKKQIFSGLPAAESIKIFFGRKFDGGQPKDGQQE